MKIINLKKSLLLSVAFFLFSSNTNIKTVNYISPQIYSSSQIWIVLTEKWSSMQGNLYIIDKANDKIWHLATKKINVTLGKNGLSWGKGLLSIEEETQKKEGDKCTPAGIFHLGDLYLRDPILQKASNHKFYIITKDMVAVDDPKSSFYNSIVRKSSVLSDWSSCEPMYSIPQYDFVIPILHNSEGTPGSGSCIFFHKWSSPTSPTAGCVATSLSSFKQILNVYKPKAKPLMIILTHELYNELRKQTEGFLPNIEQIKTTVKD